MNGTELKEDYDPFLMFDVEAIDQEERFASFRDNKNRFITIFDQKERGITMEDNGKISLITVMKNDKVMSGEAK
ncbi:MAG TPA: hypothetical protein DCW90_04770 [Lachnospiraceae bacterium]|nr:hypothetical protein [uncultured Lachnoclostridium sp.]HAU84821.1 hypothetical protein [Lachnospiraceae bacterium]